MLVYDYAYGFRLVYSRMMGSISKCFDITGQYKLILILIYYAPAGAPAGD